MQEEGENSQFFCNSFEEQPENLELTVFLSHAHGKNSPTQLDKSRHQPKTSILEEHGEDLLSRPGRRLYQIKNY